MITQIIHGFPPHCRTPLVCEGSGVWGYSDVLLKTKADM